MTETNERRVHQGRNVKRFREMMCWKQEGLAHALGEDWTQKRVSLLEAREEIDPAVLEQVAKALKVTPETIKNFNEDQFINIVQNNYDGSSNNFSGNYHCNFNPLDRYVEQVEKNEKLYEALLKSEREKITLLERILDAKG